MKTPKMLFDRHSPEIQELRLLVEKQNHRTLVVWALKEAEKLLLRFEEEVKDDIRLAKAIEKTWWWAKGEIKMPEAKKAILDCHQAAKGGSEVKEAIAHAIGQACGTVHVETHALGLVFYGLTALVKSNPGTRKEELVSQEVKSYLESLLYWQDHTDELGIDWADFLVRDGKINKEKLLREKLEAHT